MNNLQNNQKSDAAPMGYDTLLATAFSFRQFEWDYFNPPKKEDISIIVAESCFQLPEWINEKRNIRITITERKYSDTQLHYVAIIWWFNRGVSLVDSQDCVQTVNECIDLANKRMFELCTVFLGGC